MLVAGADADADPAAVLLFAAAAAAAAVRGVDNALQVLRPAVKAVQKNGLSRDKKP